MSGRIGLPAVDPGTGRAWDVGRLRHWADRLEAFDRVSAWLVVLADAVEGRAPVGLAGSDEAVEALVEAAAKAEYESAARGFTWEHDAPAETQRQLRGMLGPTVALIAARVRAEAVARITEAIREVLPEALGHNSLPDIVRGIGRQRDCQHELKDHLADVARRLTDERDSAVAGAVAEERRRALVEAADEVRREQQTVRDHQSLGFDPAGRLVILENLLRARAAGSVPVATPEPSGGIEALFRRYVTARGLVFKIPHPNGRKLAEEGVEYAIEIAAGNMPAARLELADVVLAAARQAELLGVTVEQCVEEKIATDAGRDAPVATPAEPAAKCPAGGYHAWVVVEDERRCLNCDAKEPLEAAAESSVGTGTPSEEWRVGEHYRLHVYAGDRPVATFHQEQDAAKAVAAVNAAAGAGTPAEEVSGVSRHTERREPAGWDGPPDDFDRSERQECRPDCDCMGPQERAAARIVDLEQERERLTGEVARLIDERDNACAMLQRAENESAARGRALARYQAAIEAADRQLDIAVAHGASGFKKATQDLIERVAELVRAPLAAALGDGA